MTTRLRNSNLLRGSAIYLVSNILSAAIPFLLLPVLTRYLSPEEYGEIAMFHVLLGAMAAVIGLNLHAAAGRKFYDGGLTKEELREFIGSCLQILVATTLLILMLVFFARTHLSEWLGIDQQWIFLAVLVTPCMIVIQMRLVQWQVRKQARHYGALQVSQSLVDLTLSLSLVIVFGLGASGRISGQATAVGLFALIAVLLLRRSGLLSIFIWKPDLVREALRFGVPLIPHTGGLFLLSTVDRLVINAKLGLADAGIYMVAVQFSLALSLVFDAINKAYVPWLFERLKNNDNTEKRRIVKYTYGWFVILLISAVLLFFLAPPVVVFIAGDEYARAGNLVAWLALGQIFGGMYLMVTNYIFFSKRTGTLSLITIVSGMMNLMLLYVFVERWGLKGAAYAFCVAMLFRFVLTFWLANKRHPMPWFDFGSDNR